AGLVRRAGPDKSVGRRGPHPPPGAESHPGPRTRFAEARPPGGGRLAAGMDGPPQAAPCRREAAIGRARVVFPLLIVVGSGSGRSARDEAAETRLGVLDDAEHPSGASRPAAGPSVRPSRSSAWPGAARRVHYDSSRRRVTASLSATRGGSSFIDPIRLAEGCP